METIAKPDANEPDSANDEAPGDGRPTGTRRRWLPLAVGGFALLAIAAGAIWFATSATNDTAEPAASANTAAVQRADLVVTSNLDGTLGYGEGDSIAFRTSADGVDTLPGGLSGVITAEPTVGTYYVQGDVLYEVNDQPVVILYGDVPAYRTLNTRSSDGTDIEQLERALVDLGFDPDGDITVDREFTSATRDAVERLQADIGATEDGVLAAGEYAFFPGPLYIGESYVSLAGSVQSGQPVVATSAALGNTVTWLAEEGSIIDQGDVLFAIDERPVVLLFGDTPVYRTMSLGDVGGDVTQLEQALLDLGYADTGVTVDGVFDRATLEATLAWQADIGAHMDGVVNLGEVVFQSEPIRVGDVLVTAGDGVQSGTPLITTSASSTFVTVELSTDDQDLVDGGDIVTVVLPDGTRESAVVTEIGSVVQANQQGNTFFEMRVTLDDPEAAPGLDEAPVDVEIVSDSAGGVLAVPVTALVALAEGGYAVEVISDAGTTYLVAVEPGLFADGSVEVAAQGLQDGMLVVIP